MNGKHAQEWKIGTLEAERMAFFDCFGGILEDSGLEFLAREMFLLVVVRQ